MRVSLPLWPRLPQLKPALVNGTLALWPSPNGSMNHIRAHKNDLPICQEVEKNKLILVWKLFKSLTPPPSLYSVARNLIIQDQSQCWWQSRNQVGQKRTLFSLLLFFPLKDETKPMLFTTVLISIEICSHIIRYLFLKGRDRTCSPPSTYIYAPIFTYSPRNIWMGEKKILFLLQTNCTLKHSYLSKVYHVN